MSNKNSIKGIIFALASGCCWAFSGTLGQFLFTHKGMDPSWLTVFRMITAGFIFLLMAVSRTETRQSLKQMLTSRSDMLYMVFFSIAGLLMVQYAYLVAISQTSAGVATSIQYSGESLVLLVTCVKLRRLPYRSEFCGLLIMLIAVFLISTHGKVGGMTFSVTTVIWLVTAAAALMFYTVLPPRVVGRYGSEPVMGVGFIIGGASLALTTRVWNISPGIIDGQTILCLALMIGVGTILAFSMFMRSTVLTGPVKAGMLSAIETVASPLISSLWLGMNFKLTDYAGFIMMFIMVIMLAVPELTKKTPRTSPAVHTAEAAPANSGK
ncbi:MAG: DMT family transporter [Anaerovoracaceae bacterium]|nr:DMT family transporter [Bacillota bacterium]MDY2671393.1 DMT family transporter [Anaerovoracaceae bacterium]